MFGFFTPHYLKNAKTVLHNARKLLRYREDVLKPTAFEKMSSVTNNLAASIKQRDRNAVASAIEAVEKEFGAHIPADPDAGWRENTEVFLVAVVIALGVRTYLLQPFTIPTGSMQPTLNGIIAYRSDQPSPNVLKRVFDFAWFGRSYMDAESKVEDTVREVKEVKRIPLGAGRGFFTATQIVCDQQSFTVSAQRRSVMETFGVVPGRHLQAGEKFIQGYEEVGDHVFVDKVSYNFTGPRRANVFVFSTRNIRYIENQLAMQGIQGSQYYIKRLAGLPGDRLQILTTPGAPGKLYINGSVATEAPFLRVMSGKDGYQGYGMVGLLKSPDPFVVPDHCYFALGDNSYNSQDSRYFGIVPEENLMGAGLFVYWPFGRHWGLIR